MPVFNIASRVISIQISVLYCMTGLTFLCMVRLGHGKNISSELKMPVDNVETMQKFYSQLNYAEPKALNNTPEIAAQKTT